MGHVVHIIRRDGQDRAEGEIGDPGLIEIVQAGQVIRRDGTLIFAAAVIDAGD
jgi:hypothetical protein